MKKAMSSETLQLLIASNKLVEQIDINHINDIWINIETKFNRQFKDYLSNLKSLDNWNTNYWKLYSYCNSPDYKPNDGLYNINYIAMKYNISIDEATKIVTSKKASKATNLKGFIARHGEVKGKELYEKFQKTSISGSKEQVDEYERKRRSSWCKEYYIDKGYDEQEAIKMAKEFNKYNAGANKYFWLRKGYSAKEVEQIIAEVSYKQSISNIKLHCEKLKIEIEDYMNSYENRDYNEYCRKCWIHTNISLSLYDLEDIELRGKEHGFSLDHVYSINAGFLNGVDPKYIGHITNLKIVKDSYNSSKGSKCDKTLNELINEYNLHESSFN